MQEMVAFVPFLCKRHWLHGSLNSNDNGKQGWQ